jgi:hypothetical protein
LTYIVTPNVLIFFSSIFLSMIMIARPAKEYTEVSCINAFEKS